LAIDTETGELRAMKQTAEEDELIRSNPCHIRGAGQEHHAERPLIETAMVLDLADAIGERYRALVLAAGFGGLRTGESLGLRRLDVDLLHSTVSVVQQAQEITGMGRIIVAPKSEAGRRVISIPAVVVDAFAEHLDRFTDAAPDAPVFTSPRGGPLRRASLSDAWREAVRSTGAPEGLRLHDLRHDAATQFPHARCHHQGTDGPHRALVTASRAHLPARQRGARPGGGELPRRRRGLDRAHHQGAREADPKCVVPRGLDFAPRPHVGLMWAWRAVPHQIGGTSPSLTWTFFGGGDRNRTGVQGFAVPSAVSRLSPNTALM